MAEAELRNMIMNFRVSDLQVLLGFAGRNKTGKKTELQSRAMELVKMKSPAVEMKVRELHNRRYHYQMARPSGYEIPEKPTNVRTTQVYDTRKNSYTAQYNPTSRPLSPEPHPSSSFPYSGKPYLAPSVPNAQSISHFNTYTDVKLKELPFYDVLHVLVQPSCLVSDANERYQESRLCFRLTTKQAHEVAISRKPNGQYECQLQLRFCLMDTTSEQEDNFPPNISVKVNNNNVTLPNPIPTNRPGVEPKRPSRPVNVTSFTMLSPTVSNVITVSWSATYGRSYIAALYIVRQLSSYQLLQRLKSRGVRNADFTTAMIKEKLQQGQDSEISTTSLKGSLVCPLGKIRMQLPCRAVTCNHLQCFDAYLYLQMNEKKPKWVCPVCDKPALFRSLALDGLFTNISSSVPSDCTEIEFHEDGSWTPLMPIKEEKKPVEKRPKKKESIEVVDLSDSDSEEVWSYDMDPKEVKVADPANESPPLSLSSPSLFIPPSTESVADQSRPLSPFQNFIQTPSDIIASETQSILPDLTITPVDASLPSTSSSSFGSFPQIPFLSDNSLYSGTPNGNQNTSPYSFDFLSLLNIPDVEPQKDGNKNGSLPDVISLD